MSGDDDDLAQRLQTMRPIVWRRVRRYLHDPADIKDVIQEAVYRTLKTPPVKADDRTLLAFVLTTAQNVAVSLLRHRGCIPMESLHDRVDFIDDDQQIDEIVAGWQEIKIVDDFIRTLPVNLRRVLTLDIFYSKSRAEMAEILNTTERQVRRWLNEARKRCLQELQRVAEPGAKEP